MMTTEEFNDILRTKSSPKLKTEIRQIKKLIQEWEDEEWDDDEFFFDLFHFRRVRKCILAERWYNGERL